MQKTAKNYIIIRLRDLLFRGQIGKGNDTVGNRKKGRKVVKMKKKTPIMTGLILLFFSIYLIVLFVQSFTKDHLSIYEVTEKKIADDNTVRGIILREEKLVNSSQSGYVNYYVGEGAKVGARTAVYSVDETGQIANLLSEAQQEEIKLTAQNTEEIRSEISAFRDTYDLSHFEETYNFKYNIENTVSQMANANLMDNLTQILKENGSDESFQLVRAKESGIISFTSDGMEDLDLNQITKKSFENTTDNLTQLRQTESVQAGTPVYKLVTSENWSVIVPLSKDQFRNIQQVDKVVVSLKKIHARISPQITTFTMDGGYYAKLDMNRYMIQYLNNRYLDIEIEMNDDSGLKIPLSSILQKTYYKVPKEYISKDQSGNDGVIIASYDEKGTPSFQFQASDVIYSKEIVDGEEVIADICYVDANQFSVGTTIVKDNLGSESMQLADTEELEGVYCCNKGYCEFRRIEKTYKNAEYCIIKKDTQNGLAAYDHIILNPELIGENDIIY